MIKPKIKHVTAESEQFCYSLGIINKKLALEIWAGIDDVWNQVGFEFGNTISEFDLFMEFLHNDTPN